MHVPRFLFNGGVMILVTWLSQAAAEEQTSVLIVTLNVVIKFYCLPCNIIAS
jgi:hypothetical protein